MRTDGRPTRCLAAMTLGLVLSVVSLGCAATARGTPAVVAPSDTMTAPPSPTAPPPASTLPVVSPSPRSSAPSVQPTREVSPDELEVLGLTVESVSPTGHISELRAVSAANEVYHYPSSVEVAASLFRLNDPPTLGSDIPVDRRAIWVVRFSGIDEPMGGPWVPGRSVGPVRILRTAYVFVDAESSDFLYRISIE